MEGHIAALRAELLHKEQENARVQLQLAKEKEERERAERQVTPAENAASALPGPWRRTSITASAQLDEPQQSITA